MVDYQVKPIGKRLKHVTIVACDQVMGLSLGLPKDIFYIASQLVAKRLSANTQNVESGQGFEVVMASVSGEDVKTFSELVHRVDAKIESIECTDIIVLPSLWGDPVDGLQSNATLMPWLRKQFDKGALIVANTTGAFFVAEAGLLDGKNATTHWRHFDLFERRYPLVNLCRKRFITVAENIYCCGGLNSSMDLVLYVLELYLGKEIVRKIELSFNMDIKRPYDNQFFAFDGQKFHKDEAVLSAQQWMELHFVERANLEEIANQFGMSLRTFKRRFQRATGDTPLHYIQRLRVEKAKELLMNTSEKINEISYQVGYDNVKFFSALFKKECDVTPSRFRTQWLSNSVFVESKKCEQKLK